MTGLPLCAGRRFKSFYSGNNPEVFVVLLLLSSCAPVPLKMARPALFAVAPVFAALLLSSAGSVGGNTGRRVSVARRSLRSPPGIHGGCAS